MVYERKSIGNDIDDAPPTSERSNFRNPRSTDLGRCNAKHKKTTSKKSHLMEKSISYRAVTS